MTDYAPFVVGSGNSAAAEYCILRIGTNPELASVRVWTRPRKYQTQDQCETGNRSEVERQPCRGKAAVDQRRRSRCLRHPAALALVAGAAGTHRFDYHGTAPARRRATRCGPVRSSVVSPQPHEHPVVSVSITCTMRSRWAGAVPRGFERSRWPATRERAVRRGRPISCSSAEGSGGWWTSRPTWEMVSRRSPHTRRNSKPTRSASPRLSDSALVPDAAVANSVNDPPSTGLLYRQLMLAHEHLQHLSLRERRYSLQRARDRDVERQDFQSQLNGLAAAEASLEERRKHLQESIKLDSMTPDAELVDSARALDRLRETLRLFESLVGMGGENICRRRVRIGRTKDRVGVK